MSAVRVYVDGRPTWRKADDGATPRFYGRGGGLIEPEYGSLVTGVSSRKGYEDGRRGKGPKPPRATCGKALRIIGGNCARTPGHSWDCQSAERMAKMAEARRSGVGRWP